MLDRTDDYVDLVSSWYREHILDGNAMCGWGCALKTWHVVVLICATDLNFLVGGFSVVIKLCQILIYKSFLFLNDYFLLFRHFYEFVIRRIF